MKYQCNKCFKRFDEPDYRILKDDHDFSDELGSHELAKEVCPFCGSGDIGEIAA
jgi:hypothetical protein